VSTCSKEFYVIDWTPGVRRRGRTSSVTLKKGIPAVLLTATNASVPNEAQFVLGVRMWR
jgi:hypothetical protein